MGNTQRKEPNQPATSTVKKLKPILGQFQSLVPIEVQVYTMSFLPLSEIPKLFTAYKQLNEEMKINNQLFENYYKKMKQDVRALGKITNGYKLFPRLPENIIDYTLSRKYHKKGYCENYNKIRQAFEYKLKIEREMRYFNPKASVECK